MTRAWTILGMAGVLAISAPVGARGGHVQRAGDQESRRFHFEYTTTITDIPADAGDIRLWIPIPQSDENQQISNLSVTSTPALPQQFATEEEYGNRYIYLHTSDDVPGEVTVVLRFDVLRHETQTLHILGMDGKSELLADDAMAPITDEVKQRARAATTGRTTTVEKARAIYDRVLNDMNYDKSGTGWGRGDIQYACDVGTGNCSDFHTLFIGMSRAVKIPAWFEIGFPLPPDQTAGEISGYHCWAWFQDANGAWRPVDVSEADKNPDMTDYFFGTICCNRVAFTRGRDLQLTPAPASGTVNFFIDPIVEIDGETAEGHVKTTFTFHDLETID